MKTENTENPYPEKVDGKDSSCNTPISSDRDVHVEWTRKKVLKNLLIISLTFLLLFTSYLGVATLQSTMNSEEGVGVLSQATIYVFFCISALFLPKYAITKLGCKTALILSIITYCPYVAANFYAHWVTMIPSAILLGIGASLLWSGKCIYINELSSIYCALGSKNDKIHSVTARFFGFSGAIFMSTHVWGNLISFYILEKDYLYLTFINNATTACGVAFCSDEHAVDENPNLNTPSDKQRFMLSGIYVFLMVLSVVSAVFFLDSLPRDQGQKHKQTVSTKDLLASTLKLTKHPNQLLLMALPFYVGLAESFYVSDYTMAYVACTWGIYHVGIVTICNGIACSVSSSLSGFLVKYLGRPTIFVTSAVVNVAVYVLLFTWTPDSRHPLMLFIVSGLWGFFVGIFWTQIRALYGVLFKSDEEAGFANYYLWNSLGFCLTFSYSKYLCMATKIYIASSILGASMILYLILEIKLVWEKKKQSSC